MLFVSYQWYSSTYLNIYFEYNNFIIWVECREGWYGVNCKQQCVGYCREGTTCNHVTGQCDRGCDAEWTGYMCDKCNFCNISCPIRLEIKLRLSIHNH